jgi:hypothetical protein
MVLESAEEVVEKVIQFRKALLGSAHCPLKITDRTLDDGPDQVDAGRKSAASWAK